jgi:hypothetical protein
MFFCQELEGRKLSENVEIGFSMLFDEYGIYFTSETEFLIFS